jgi:hypothetical protein
MKLETTDQIPMGFVSMVSLSLLTLLLPLFVAFVWYLSDGFYRICAK